MNLTALRQKGALPDVQCVVRSCRRFHLTPETSLPLLQTGSSGLKANFCYGLPSTIRQGRDTSAFWREELGASTMTFVVKTALSKENYGVAELSRARRTVSLDFEIPPGRAKE